MASSTNDAVNPHAQRANEVQAAKDAVVEAAANALHAYQVWDEDIIGGGFDFRLAMIVLHDALHELDALQAEPPEGESAEPELPPRGVAWREMMSRVDHEGGC